jgi:large subunit ribosomal protein L4
VEALPLDEIKTRRVREMLEALSLGGSSVLIVIDEADEKLERSARNLPKVAVLRVAGLNVYDVLRHEKLLVTRAAVATIEARLGGSGEVKS